LPAAVLTRLPKSARLAYPFVKRAVSEGLSANAALKAWRESGGAIRRQTFLDLYRTVKGVEQAGARLRNLPLHSRPNPDRLPPAVHPILRRYSFEVRLRGVDSYTGETVERYITVSSNDLLTRREIELKAEEAVERFPENYPFILESALLVGGKRSPDLF